MMLFAKLLSGLFNPVLIAVLAPYLIVYKSTHAHLYALKWVLFSLIFVSGEVLFILYGVKKGFFSDLDVSKKEERKLLYYFTGFVAIVYFVFLILLHAPRALIIGIISVMIGIIIMGIINRTIKASGHVAVLSSFIIALSLWYSIWFLLAIVFIPLVAWARIEMKKHTLLEAFMGGTVGTAVTLLTYLVVEYML